MLRRARKTLKKFDFNQKHPPSGCRNPVLSLRMVHQLARASVTQRLDLIRIRLLRAQLEELYKIKNLLEQRINEQRETEEEQRKALKREIEELRVQLERETKESAKKREAEAEAERQRQYNTNTSLINLSIMEDDENVPPPAYYTPDEEQPDRKEYKCGTIEEEDDLIPMLNTPPSRSHPRQSIGQWSVERAKNNMSVRSLVSSLEVKVGPKGASGGTRTRAQK